MTKARNGRMIDRHQRLVLIEGRGDRALARINEIKPDLVILDVMLPGKDGFDVCRELRASGSNIAVIILTAKD